MKEQVIDIIWGQTPEVKVRVIETSDTKELINSKKKYPFELENSVDVRIITNKREVDFTIFNGYTWNGADIPRFLWRCVGSRTDNEFLVASMVHDYLLEFRIYMLNEVFKNNISVKEYRRLTSLIFRHILKMQGTGTIKANIMSWTVQVFQTLFCRKAWDKCR